MAAYYNFHTHSTHQTPAPHNPHGGRNRRAARLSVSQNSQRQFRNVGRVKDMNDSASLVTFRMKFEAGRSFELEDDLEFCPNLLTDSDISSMSSASERSSLASNSPQSSPTQQPQTVAPGFSLNTSSPPFVPPTTFHLQQPSFKIHQPTAARGRNAIPIVNPATGISMSSPPSSVSPGKMQQSMMRRW